MPEQPEGTIRMGLVREIVRVGCTSIAAAAEERDFAEAANLADGLRLYLRSCAIVISAEALGGRVLSDKSPEVSDEGEA